MRTMVTTVMTAVVVGMATVAQAQTTPSASLQGPGVVKSRTEKFFVGGQYEGTGLAFTDGSNAEGGPGFGVVAGYGFTPNVAVYTQWSAANIRATETPNYGWGHFDVGVRVHLLKASQRLRPYVEGGVSGRAMQMTLDGDVIKGNGAGAAFGGGLNVHLTPVSAFTVGVVWATGHIGHWTMNNQGGFETVPNLSVTSARVQVGFVFFPQRGSGQ